MNLSKMNAGDRVVVRVPVSLADWREYIDVIDRTTQTQIILSDCPTRFYRRSGYAVGGDRFDERRKPHIVPENWVPAMGSTDEQDMAQMRQDVQAAAALFELEPTSINYDRLATLVARWRDIAYLPTRI